MACEIREPDEVLSDKRKAELYWKSFRALMLKRATQVIYPRGDRLNSEFIEKLPTVDGFSGKANPFEGIERPFPMERESGLPLGIRNRPSLNKEHGRLDLDFDIVPYIPEGRLHDVLFGVIGKNSFLTFPFDNLHVLKELLRGLRVRCAYTMPDTIDIKAVVLDDESLGKGLHFRLVDMKMPDQVSIKIDGSKLSVQDFFESSRFFPMQ